MGEVVPIRQSTEAEEWRRRLTSSAEWREIPSILVAAARAHKEISEALLERDVVEALRQALELRAYAEALHAEIEHLPRFE